MNRLQTLKVSATFAGLLTLAPLARAEALVWFGLPWLLGWLLKSKVIAAMVTLATIASGVHAMLEMSGRAGYQVMPDSAVTDNERLLREEYDRVQEEQRDHHPLLYCYGKYGERMLVNENTRVCPYDGTEPRTEDHYVFHRDGDRLKVEIRRASHK